MLVLKNNIPTTFDILYNISTEDGKSAGDISTAKFFLATAPGEADTKYFLKTYGSGLAYSDSTGRWTITVAQEDLDNSSLYEKDFEGILAIQYAGDTDYREPDLYEGSSRLTIRVEPSYSD